MPYKFINLQFFSDEGDFTDAGVVTGEAENPVGDGVATETDGEQIATANEESWDSLIKGKYKDDYNKAVKDAVSKRFKNQRDLQGQIDMINPMIQQLASRYDVKLNPDGSIPIDALTQKVLDDNSMYEQEAFSKGMSVSDLKQMKTLERENQLLKAQSSQAAADREWAAIMQDANKLKEIYPEFDMDMEMQNPRFASLFSTLQKSGFPEAVRTAYESVHRDQIMGGAMQYGVQKAQQKLTSSIQANMARPSENGTQQQSTARVGEVDPSKLTKAQIDDLRRRAERGERITFA